MTPKEFLMLAWQIDKRIAKKIDERNRFMDQLTGIRAADLTGMPKGGKHDWTDTIAAVADLEDSIRIEIQELCRIKQDVNAAIEAVRDQQYRYLLELRYRNYMSWNQIAEEMEIELRNVHYMHGKALLCVVIPQAYRKT